MAGARVTGNRSCCESSKLGRQVYSGNSSSGPRSHCVLFCSETAWGPTGLPVSCSPPCSQRHLRRPDPRWPRCWRCLSEAQMCALVMSFPSQVFSPAGWHVSPLHACTRFPHGSLSWAWPGHLQQTKAGYWQWKGGRVLVLPCPAAHMPLQGRNRA